MSPTATLPRLTEDLGSGQVRVHHRPLRPVLLSLLLLLAPSAAGAATVRAQPYRGPADRVIAHAPFGPSLVEAYGGNLVWGVNQTLEGPTHYFVRDARGTRRILTGIFAMDLDLGARRGGGTQAVFTAFRTPGRLEILTRDFRSGAVRTLPSLWRPRGLERSPSVWKGRFAFVRGQVASLVPPLAAPRALGLFATSPLRVVSRARVLSTDLRGSRLAYVTAAGTQTTTMRVVTLPRGRARGRSCFVARATRRRIALSTPVLAGSYVYWLRKDVRANRATVRRRPLPAPGCRPRGREQHSREVPGMESFAVDRRRFFYTTAAQVREATPPFAFSR